MFEGLFQPLHMILILAIALILFGPGKLPELGKGLGQGIKEFKKALAGEEKKLLTDDGKSASKQEDSKS